jgi:hypothetical protein
MLMNTKHKPAFALAGCQALFLGGMLSLPADIPAAGMPTATDPAYPPHMAQPAPGQGAGGYRMRPGSPGMSPGQGHARYGMDRGQPPGSYGMAPGQGHAGYGMSQPQAGGMQGMGPGSGRPGFGMPPGRQQPVMTGPAMGGPGAAMLNSIGAMNLTSEQRSQLDSIREQLRTRQQELAEKLRAEGEKMRKLQEEQLRLRQTLTDLQGHMMQAVMDAANRAEELLTEEQRQAMIDRGRHVMMRPAGAGSPAQPRGGTE